MTQIKVSLQNSKTWNEKRRYKINDTVTHLAVGYQNVTGINTEPGTDSNWRIIPMTDLANNLTTIVAGKALDATQGKILKDLVDLRQVKQSNLIFVQSLSDLPTPVSNVITLITDTAYVFTKTVDLTGNRIVSDGNNSIIGFGNSTSKIISTGLSSSSYLIFSNNNLFVSNIALKHDRIIQLTPSIATTYSHQYVNTTFLDGSTMCLNIGSASNLLIDRCAFVNCKEINLSGTTNSVVINGSSIVSSSGAGVVINASSLVINTRFRVVYSVIQVNTTGAGIQATAANIPNESFILNTVYFSGTGSALAGTLDSTSNKAFIINCVGVTNTSTIGFLSMTNNATATIQTSPTWTKALGTTTASSVNSKFTHTDNRLTYTGAFTNTYLASLNANLYAAHNGQVLSIGLAKNGTIIAESEMTVRYIDGSNPINASCNIPVSLTANDYIEVFIRNSTSNSNVTVQDMQLMIKKIPV